MLRTALGSAIATWLEDPAVVEVMLNPDGRIWIDRLTDGLADTGERLAPADGERIIRLVAHHVGAEVHPGSPRVSAELPETGERFEGLLPPIVAAPAFAIRKPAVAIFTLNDYVAASVMLPEQATVLRLAVERRRNVLVAGGTSTGKTTLANALLAEVATLGPLRQPARPRRRIPGAAVDIRRRIDFGAARAGPHDGCGGSDPRSCRCTVAAPGRRQLAVLRNRHRPARWQRRLAGRT